jgi:DNA-binding SARP family transcriptional activator
VAVDADKFERDVLQARAARTESAGFDAYRAALRIYGGAFLPTDLYADWIAVRRDRLKERFIDAAMATATYALEADDLELAIELAAQVSELDGAHEDAARVQMRSLARLGRRAEALRCFERLRNFLQRDLGCPPDPSTTALHAELLGKAPERPGWMSKRRRTNWPRVTLRPNRQ